MDPGCSIRGSACMLPGRDPAETAGSSPGRLHCAIVEHGFDVRTDVSVGCVRHINGIPFIVEHDASFSIVLVVTGCQQTRRSALHDIGV